MVHWDKDWHSQATISNDLQFPRTKTETQSEGRPNISLPEELTKETSLIKLFLKDRPLASKDHTYQRGVGCQVGWKSHGESHYQTYLPKGGEIFGVYWSSLKVSSLFLPGLTTLFFLFPFRNSVHIHILCVKFQLLKLSSMPHMGSPTKCPLTTL